LPGEPQRPWKGEKISAILGEGPSQKKVHEGTRKKNGGGGGKNGKGGRVKAGCGNPQKALSKNDQLKVLNNAGTRAHERRKSNSGRKLGSS